MRAIPRAAGPLGLAAMQTRAARTGEALRPRRRVVVRLWVPLTPIFWLLSPVPLALAPLIYLAPARVRPADPFAAVLALGRLLTALGGAVVDVDTPDCLVQLRIL